MKAKQVEHFLDWRKSTNQAGTHKVNRLANSDKPVLDKKSHNNKNDVVAQMIKEGFTHIEATEALKGWDIADDKAVFTLN